MREPGDLGMLYHITGLCPRTDMSLGRCGFCIQLYPAWSRSVAKSGLTQENINTAIETYHRLWLDGCGYGQMYDPDKDARAEWEERNLGKKLKLGPRARHLYGPRDIRVTWGEWGPEHITVPGNACNLDIDQGIAALIDGRILVPHNIDSLNQVVLLLTVFTTFAEHVIGRATSNSAQQ